MTALPQDGSRQALPEFYVNNPNVDPFATGANFTQSGARMAIMKDGNAIVTFEDSGSLLAGNHSVGWAISDSSAMTSFTDKGALPNSTAGDGGFATVAVDLTSGRVYLAALASSDGDNLPVFRSDDNGLTFGAPVNATAALDGSGITHRRNQIAVDNFAGTGRGNVYLATASSSGGVRMLRSTDGGDTWTNNSGLGTIINAAGFGPSVAISPNHDVHVAYYNARQIWVARSVDGGQTFAAPVAVTATLNENASEGNLGLEGGFASNSFPRLAAHPTDANQLYVVYNDNTNTTFNADVFFQQSLTAGATWETRLRVNDDLGTNDQFFPAIAVTEDGANLMVSFQDRRLDPQNLDIDQWGRVASIAGTTLTFKPAFRITQTSYPIAAGIDSAVSTGYMGDGNQVVGGATFFHFPHAANRYGSGEPFQPDVFYSRIPGTGPGDVLILESVRYEGVDGDFSWSPNECVSAYFTVVNQGSETSTGARVTALFSSDGWSSPAPTALFPDIPPGTRAESLTPVRMHVTNIVECGDSYAFQVALQSDQTPSSYPFVQGRFGDAGTPVEFNSTGAVAIPDNNTTGVESPITVAGFTQDVFKATVSVRLTHPFMGDVEMTLISPSGREVDLSFDMGGSGDNMGTDCPAGDNDTIFDDDATQRIDAGSAPFVGSFRPLEKLSAVAFTGAGSANGTWKLRVVDDAGDDIGSLDCWSLKLYPQACVAGTGTCDFAPLAILGSYTDTALGNANGAIDPDECVSLGIVLYNLSEETGTNVSATVTSLTPGVVVFQGNATYPDIPPSNGVGPTTPTPIMLSVSDAALCAQNPLVHVTITSDQSVTERDLPLTVLGSDLTSTTFTATGPVAIPDNDPTGATLDIPVSGITGSIGQVVVGLHVTHSFLGDLQVELVSPDNTVVMLFDESGGGRDNLGTGCPVDADDLFFNDGSTFSVESVEAPYANSTLKPVGFLADFTGKSGSAANGTWKLRVRDDAALDVGNIECALLRITSKECSPDGGDCTQPHLRIDSFGVNGGNGDNYLDPDECAQVNVRLENYGVTSVTGITATLTSQTPGVSISSGNSTYTNIPIGATRLNQVPFGISVNPAITCGDVAQLTLTVQSNQGTRVIPFTVATGHPDSLFTLTSAVGPVAIPDNDPAGAELNVPIVGFTGRVREVEVALHLTHTFTSDLLIELISPTGTVVTLSKRRGGASDNFGTDCPPDANDTRFDDDATQSIASGSGPFVGTFRPDIPLSTFDGMSAADANGIWKLRVTDRAALDTGSINCAQVTIFPVECAAGNGACATPDDAVNVILGTLPPPIDLNSDGITDSADVIEGYIP